MKVEGNTIIWAKKKGIIFIKFFFNEKVDEGKGREIEKKSKRKEKEGKKTRHFKYEDSGKRTTAIKVSNLLLV